MIITSSHNRLRQSPHWCLDGDRWSHDMLAKLRVLRPDLEWDSDSEVDARDVLKTAGMAATLYTLGLPRPRYAVQAEAVLKKYVDHLFALAEEALSRRLGKLPVEAKQARLRYADEDRREALLNKWIAVKYSIESPDMGLIINTYIMLLREIPVYVRATHATKALLELPEHLTAYPAFTEYMDSLLNE